MPLLNLNLGLTADPSITFIKTSGTEQALFGSDADPAKGFMLDLELALPYAELSHVLTGYLQGKRFELSEGFIKQHVIIKTCKVTGNGAALVIQVQFSGSFDGTLYFTGKPVYDAVNQSISLANFGYDLETANFLLKGAKWLFNKIILDEIKKYAVFDLRSFHKKATDAIAAFLNKEWTKGVQATGRVESLAITGILPQPQQLSIRCRCGGSLKLMLSELHLKL